MMAPMTDSTPHADLTAFPCWFVSDAHLGADDAATEARKHAALQQIVTAVIAARGTLVILGDLFDFGFSYRSYVPAAHKPALELFLQLRQARCPVYYLAGNHDCWYGDYLTRTFGFAFYPDRLELRHDGKRFLVAHGDGLAAREGGYRLLRRLLRSPLSVALYRLIPARAGSALALACSRLSRAHGRRQHPPDPQPLADFARRQHAAGYDAVILGHAHAPFQRGFEQHTYVNTGDLQEHFTYATYDGNWQLHQC